MSARNAAQERVAQTYSSAVSKALLAIMASDTSLTGADVVGGTYNCGAGAAETTQVVVNGTAYAYGWEQAPPSVTGCGVAVNAVLGTPDVEITTEENTYVNGVVQ